VLEAADSDPAPNCRSILYFHQAFFDLFAYHWQQLALVAAFCAIPTIALCILRLWIIHNA
jgi:hypothetical protein